MFSNLLVYILWNIIRYYIINNIQKKWHGINAICFLSAVAGLADMMEYDNDHHCFLKLGKERRWWVSGELLCILFIVTPITLDLHSAI